MRKVFLDDLPRWEGGKGSGRAKEGTINWGEAASFNCRVKFIYDNIESEIELIAYSKKNQCLTVKYNENECRIRTGSLLKSGIGMIIDKITVKFKVEIGTYFNSHGRSLTITDRYYILKNRKSTVNGKDYPLNEKHYRYLCNKCGYKGDIIEGNLLKGHNCSCCANKVTIKGVNDIKTTASFMISLGVSEEDAQRYTKSSNELIFVECPDCKRKKRMKISDICTNRSIGCSFCGIRTTYPEKFMTSVLDQLGVKYICQLSKTKFEWCKNYRYDFYLPHYNTIIETHGEQHYKDKSLSKWQRLKEVQENDMLKRHTAIGNDISNYIVIDCRNSELEWLENNILNSKLNELFDLSKVNFEKADLYSIRSNKIKEICDYWRNKEEWETVSDLGEFFGLHRGTIRDYLKRGVKLGWIDYSEKEEKSKSASNNAKTRVRKVEVFKNEVSLGIFKSLTELEMQSQEYFGVKLLCSNVSAICLGKRKTYKDYTFKYVE